MSIPWDEAWRITTDTISYTNHTLLPEALESWPVSLMERLLPRHMQIIYQINRLHLDAVCALPRRDGPPLAALSLIDDNAGRRVRMSTLAFLGSHKVNGVSALHTELMRQTVFRELHAHVSRAHRQQDQRHHVPPLAVRGEPRLTSLLAEVIGERVLDDAIALDDFAVSRTTPRCMNGFARHPPHQQAGAGAACGGAAGHPVGSRCAVRCADQAHPRVQAAVAEHP